MTDEVKLYTFFPEVLGKGVSVTPSTIHGWKKSKHMALECQSSNVAYVATITRAKLHSLQTVDWITPTSRQGEFIHRGIRYDNKISVPLLARFLKVSKATSYTYLQALVDSNEMVREKNGKRYLYKISI